ncbi:MAG: hypothetical protein U0136_16930 [Bdellovibrionota bacterium]
MQFDDGEVLQGLDEEWTFMGANAMEWACGLVVFVMISLFADSPARAMPFMLLGWVLTTTSLAAMRRGFPDQERGVRNAVCVACGFPPPGIPAPSVMQPVWSGCPMREVNKNSKFVQLGLSEMFPSFERQFTEPEE